MHSPFWPPPVCGECAGYCGIPEQQGEPVDIQHRGAVPQPTHKAGKALQIHRCVICEACPPLFKHDLLTAMLWACYVTWSPLAILHMPSFMIHPSLPPILPPQSILSLSPSFPTPSLLPSNSLPHSHTSVTSVIMQKNGAGLHTASSCFWDNSTDGECVPAGVHDLPKAAKERSTSHVMCTD